MQDSEESDQHGGAMNRYRTAPLRFPLHVLDEDGEPLCGSMADDQRRFVDRHGVECQPTLAEKREQTEWVHFVSGLCGNCLRSLLSKTDQEDLHNAAEEVKQVRQEVTA